MSGTPPLRPQEPRLLAGDLPGVGGRIGEAPEDFLVDEIPRFEPAGSGDHLLVRVRKRELTTPDLIRMLARAAGVRERDLGHAGMKDKQAITSQWVSLPASCRDPEQWSLPDGVELLEHARHTNKLRTGQLRGNRFSVRLVGVEPEAFDRAAPICERLRQSGLPNYFGEQRFGRGAENLHRAVDWLKQGAPGRGRKTRFFRKLYPSVIQSEIFNRTLTLRLERHSLAHLVAGDVVRLDGSRTVFVVEDPDAEQPRLASGDIHLTGPILGPKMKAPTGEPAALEAEALAALDLGDEDVALLGRMADGTRRDLVVAPEGLEVQQLPDGCLRLDFALPSGSYATGLVRELTRAPWFRTPEPAQ